MRQKLPEWVKRGIIDTETTRTVRKILRENNLNTVCESARCPNKSECYSKNTATFMILGNTCTRNCKFCSVNSGIPEPINPNEPDLIAEAVKKLGLNYVVVTSVTRDDLEDGGAMHFANTIRSIKKIDNEIKVEVLTPDFQGNLDSINVVIEAKPDVFNHNIETVETLYPKVRPQAEYKRSLEMIKYIKSENHEIYTKSGFMVGLGETFKQISELLQDLKEHNCDIVTVGQYIQPTRNHLEVSRYLQPEEFDHIKQLALETGIKYPISAPLVRSSYKAKEIICGTKI
ncbi:MAG: lipoyl synthase [Candidatus Melainabacteria bacterium RIFOXYA12_FULL_32_12]|nr:MAG: lipoyl synthase [Candidatus Melainabacteria bacterium RIFOXYA2_FULL_32_9]OGI28865.1 MAG: lipoyl synthase [Candidatus Melainabacteria bacterium RIFOXYA12_FULL_32_12]